VGPLSPGSPERWTQIRWLRSTAILSMIGSTSGTPSFRFVAYTCRLIQVMIDTALDGGVRATRTSGIASLIR